MARRRSLRPNVYTIVSRAVEDGVLYGIHRAYKHRDDPPAEDLVATLTEQIVNTVMLELSGVIEWGDD